MRRSTLAVCRADDGRYWATASGSRGVVRKRQASPWRRHVNCPRRVGARPKRKETPTSQPRVVADAGCDWLASCWRRTELLRSRVLFAKAVPASPTFILFASLLLLIPTLSPVLVFAFRLPSSPPSCLAGTHSRYYPPSLVHPALSR